MGVPASIAAHRLVTGADVMSDVAPRILSAVCVAPLYRPRQRRHSNNARAPAVAAAAAGDADDDNDDSSDDDDDDDVGNYDAWFPEQAPDHELQPPPRHWEQQEQALFDAQGKVREPAASNWRAFENELRRRLPRGQPALRKGEAARQWKALSERQRRRFTRRWERRCDEYEARLQRYYDAARTASDNLHSSCKRSRKSSSSRRHK
jgi:hypothetical protein